MLKLNEFLWKRPIEIDDISFIRNLEAVFCEEDELRLNTKSNAEDPDMTNILAKFENLKSLHLALSSIKFDKNQAHERFVSCQQAVNGSMV